MKTITALILLAAVAVAGYNDVRITEIMFHPSEAQLNGNPEGSLEWIEIQNTGSMSVQVGDYWELVIVGQGTITLQGNTSLAAGEYAIIPLSWYWFEEQYGTSLTTISTWSGSGITLDNDSQALHLKYNDQIVDSVHYYGDWGSDYGDSNSTPDCNGDGASLERGLVTGDPNDPMNWQSSTDEASGYSDEDWPGHNESWGTPCAANSVGTSALQRNSWGAIKVAFSE